ncbi:MAG: hypothetical protein ACR2NO_12630 [Chloroflexota bacterium]
MTGSARATQAEEAGELSRYRADMVAALTPTAVAVGAGAVSGFLVFFVPVAFVAGSMLLLSFTFNVGILPLQFLVRALGIRVPRGAPASGSMVAPTAAPVARPTEIPALPIEGPLPDDGAGLVALGLVLAWPLAMLAVGAVASALYRLRRRRAVDALRRSPAELAILPEVIVFYALTAGVGLLVGVGSFVALGANVAFAWAGYLIWRWLFDRLAWHFSPAAVRIEAQDALERERDYRRRAREAG